MALTGRARARNTAIVVALLAALAAGFWWWFVPTWRPPLSDQEVYGVDVSHHQGEIDWAAVADDDIEFAYIKATEGGDFPDTRFEENWKGAAEAGLRRATALTTPFGLAPTTRSWHCVLRGCLCPSSTRTSGLTGHRRWSRTASRASQGRRTGRARRKRTCCPPRTRTRAG